MHDSVPTWPGHRHHRNKSGGSRGRRRAPARRDSHAEHGNEKRHAEIGDEIPGNFCLTFYDTRRIVTAYGGCRKSEEGERMARDVPTLGELEIRVLRLVWEHQPCTERQISDLIQADREVARTTVLKTMQR